MPLDSVERFTSRVTAYARYRPPYPPGILEHLARECGLTPQSVIADIGCGTGLLTQLFLQFGCEVFGVEPNADMRAACARILSGESRLHLIDGRAESTTLPDDSIDFITAGQAFHWFDAEGARREFRRILRPGAWVVLVWNERVLTPGFMQEHEALIDSYAPEKPHPALRDFDSFFGASGWKLAAFPNPQSLDWEGLRGRLESSSHSPLPGSAEYGAMAEALHRLFEKCAQNGRIVMEYETRMYYGTL
jgi:SAM-dependent methyltransferase